MDHVVVKVKRLRKKPYRKLLSDTTLYPLFNEAKETMVEYNPDHNLDEDSWFKVEEFSKKPFFLDLLSQPIDVKDYNELSKEKFDSISCIIGLQGDDVYFQKVTPSSFIRRKFILFGEVAKLEDSADRILVKANPDAIYIRKIDTLIFKDIASISSIFKGIDQLYKEATEDEVNEFLKYDFIQISGNYKGSDVSKPNRKRLALVSDTMKNMPEAQRINLVDYILEYCKDKVQVTEDGKSFELSTDNQLKFILYGIEERFYTTQHSQQKRLANSVEAMANN